ncbi:MAG: RrF2 family transcriptional regulator [Bacteroidales bacterium]
MLIFSKSCKYAIRACTYLFSNTNGVETEDKLIQLTEITNDLELPKFFLAKILNELTRRGAISAYKGMRGGYTANDRTGSITVYEIIVFISGERSLNICLLGDDQCAYIDEKVGKCEMHTVSLEMREHLHGIFKDVTIEKLAIEGSRLAEINTILDRSTPFK